ncbi:phosphatase PAP2 family protein [Alkalicoccus luteus]|uniref:Phosphatase PAP2 family protein n=1 Tax=Alkalicoccus luteus TaxID=1237094 RepID=A0A969PR53_9BACI|nr:phosphatase PAP2 family protein [Alkalicoccus luteus]NJP36901.1 phosphatase PAP2 family protein [Alkalicoccus luteus]
MEQLFLLDRQLLELFNQQWTSSALDPFMRFATLASDIGLIWYATALLLMLVVRSRRALLAGIAMIAANGAAFLFQALINVLLPRPRPPLVEEGIRLIVEAPASSSFPSAHAATSAAACTALILFYPKAAWIAVPFALLFAYTRLYAGVHYPSDTLAGLIFGIGIGIVAAKLVQRKGGTTSL